MEVHCAIEEIRKTKANYKPDSVDTRRYPATIYLRDIPAHLTETNLPTCAYFVLLQEGLARAYHYWHTLCALTAHFHPYPGLFYPTTPKRGFVG